MKKYLVISRYDDTPSISMMTESDILQSLKEDWNGFKFLSEPGDIEYFLNKSVFIFKGEVIIPQPVQIITEYKL
jgi:hypothetical protein